MWLLKRTKERLFKFTEWLSNKINIRGDYILHFMTCMSMSVAGMHGALFAAGWSIGKETGDYNNPNSGWSWADLVADGLGITAGLAVNMAIKAIIN